MIPTMQFQILIDIGRINPIFIICVFLGFFSPPFRLGAFSSNFMMTSFTWLSVTLLVYNAASKIESLGQLTEIIPLAIH